VLKGEAIMAAIKNILVPTDFSEASRQALRYACNLADTVGASLHLLHVTENPYFTSGYMEVYAPPPEYFAQVEQQARKGLEEALTPVERQRTRATLVRRTGSPATEILRYLRERDDIDLVVMATHGRGAVARLMMGSVADKVVRAAPCPVLTIRDLEGSPARYADHAA
jgi:nucleotide-binding universal stress UspA family protein